MTLPALFDLFSDDDEDDNMNGFDEASFKDVMLEIGLGNYLTNIDMKSRTGLDHGAGLFRPPQSKEDLLSIVLGPTGGILSNLYEFGSQLNSISEDATASTKTREVAKAFLNLAPNAFKNVGKAVDWATNEPSDRGKRSGAVGRSKYKDMDAYDIAAKAFGFNTADVSRDYDKYKANKSEEDEWNC